jgi:hypothetical protein
MISALMLVSFLVTVLQPVVYSSPSRDSLAPKSSFKDAKQIEELTSLTREVAGERERQRSGTQVLFTMDDLIGGTPLSDELQNINRGKPLVQIHAVGDKKSVASRVAAALKDVSPEQMVFLSCRVRTAEPSAEDGDVPSHSLVRHVVVVARAKAVKERIDDALAGRHHPLDPYLAINVGEYREDKNLHIYGINLAEAFRGKRFMSDVFDNLSRILQKQYGGYWYTSNTVSDAIEHFHETGGLVPFDRAGMEDAEEQAKANRLLARVREFEFVGDDADVVCGRIPRYLVSAEVSEQRDLLSAQARRYGITVDVEARTIQGKPIRAWAKEHFIMFENSASAQSALLYKTGESLQYYRYPAEIKEVEDYILTYARSIEEETQTRKWMNDLKAAARRSGRDQKDYITGLDGPHKFKKSLSPLEWAVRGEYLREFEKAQQEKLLGSFPVEGARIEDLPVWPVDENGRVIEDLISWMRTPGARPPFRYFRAEKVTLLDLVPRQLTLDFGSRQIGKRAHMESVSGSKARVVDSQSNLHYLALEPQGKIAVDALRSRLEKMKGISEPHKNLLLLFLGLLEKSPPEKRPEMFTFRDFVEDLYGFSSADQQIIALHDYLSDNLVAVFHEIGEYLVDAGGIHLSLFGNRLVIEGPARERLGEIALGPDAMRQTSKGRNDSHYLLRALQREIFGNQDRALTDKIKFIGNIEIESKRAGMDDIDALLKELIVKTDDFERIISEVVREKIRIGDLSGRIKIASFAEGSNKKVYKVTFYTKDDKTLDAVVALKKEKGSGRIPQSEIEDLRWLSTAKRKVMELVPVFGFTFTAKDGTEMYVEQFIEGNTVEDYRTAGTLTWDMKKKIISNLFTIGIMLGNQYPKDVHERNFIITPKNNVVMIDIGNKRFSIPETLRNGDYKTMAEFIFLIIAHYSQEGEDSYIGKALFQSLKDVNDFLKKNNTQVLRVKKTIGEARAEIIRFLDGTRRYLMNLNTAEREKLVASLMASTYMRGYFKQHDVPENERRLFVEKNLTRVMNLLRIDYTSPQGIVDLLPPSRIGRRAFVESTGDGIARVKDARGIVQQVPLGGGVPVPYTDIKFQIEQMTDVDQRYRQMLLQMLSLLEKSPPEKQPRLYTYTRLVEDLFGFASPQNNMIALYADLAANPVALMHEILEYAADVSPQALQDIEALLTADGRGWLRDHEQKYEDMALADYFRRNRPHFVIRAFARQAFGQRDVALTQKIQELQAARAGAEGKARQERRAAELASLAEIHERFYNAIIAALMEKGIGADEKQQRMDAAFEALVDAAAGDAKKRLYRSAYAGFKRMLAANSELLRNFRNDRERKQFLLSGAAARIGYAEQEDIRRFSDAATYGELFPGVPIVEMERSAFAEFVDPQIKFKGAGAITFLLDKGVPPFILIMEAVGVRHEKVLRMKIEHELQHMLHYFVYEAGLGELEGGGKEEPEEALALRRFKNELCSYILGYDISPVGMVPARVLVYSENPEILAAAGRARDFIDLCIKLAGTAGIPPTRFIYPILRAKGFDDIKEKCFSIVPVPREPGAKVSQAFQDAFMDKAKAYMFAGDDNITRFFTDTIAEVIARLQSVYTNDQLRALYEEVLNRTYTFMSYNDIRKNISGGQIGKRAYVEDVSGGAARVKGKKNEDVVVPLSKAGSLDVAELHGQLGPLTGPQYAQTLGDIMDLLGKSPPDTYTFDILVEDLFAFAAAPNMIAVYEPVAANPVALFHEACESLLLKNDLQVTLENEQLTVRLASGASSFIPLDQESLAIARKDPANQHYLLRALARTMFGSHDAQLTRDIKNLQRIEALEAKAVLGDAASVRSFREIAIHPDTGPAATGAALKAVENVIDTEDLGTLVYAECAAVIRMIFNAKPSALEPSTVMALEKTLRRYLGVYAYEESAAALREIAIKRPELIQASTVDALAAMLRESGIQSHNASGSIIHTLKDIVERRPECIPELVKIVDGIWAIEGLRLDMYGAAVSFKRVVAEKKPELIKKSDIENVEKILKARTLTVDGYREAALFMRAVNRRLPVYAQQAQRVVEKLLNREAGNQQILKAVQQSFYNGGMAQIGKRGQVSRIYDAQGKRYAQVVDRRNPAQVLGSTELVPRKDVSELERALTVLSRGAPQGRGLEEFLKLLRISPPPEICAYPSYYADVFGFALPDKRIIGIYEPLLDNPLAMFHEYGEYLIGAGLLDLALEDATLKMSLRSSRNEPFRPVASYALNPRTREFIENEKWPLEGEKRDWRTDDHYLLRVLQRELFPEADAELTRTIQHLQDAAELERRACGDIGDAVNKLIYLAYNLKADPVVSRRAVAALEKVLKTDGLGFFTYTEAVSGIRVCAISALPSVTPETVSALEHVLLKGAGENFLLREVCSALSEISHSMPLYLRPSTVAALKSAGGPYADTALSYIGRSRPDLVDAGVIEKLVASLDTPDQFAAERMGEIVRNIARRNPQGYEGLSARARRAFDWFAAFPYVRTFYDEYMRADDPQGYSAALASQNDAYIDPAGLSKMIDDFVADQDGQYSNLTVIVGRPFPKQVCGAIDTLNRDLKRAAPEGTIQFPDADMCHTTVIAAGRIVREYIPKETYEKTKESLAPVIEGLGSIEGLLRGELKLTPSGVVILEVKDPEIIAAVERIRTAVNSREAYGEWYRPKIVHISLGRLKTTGIEPEEILKIRDVLNRWNASGPFVKGIPVAIETVQFGLFSPIADKMYYASEFSLQPPAVQPYVPSIDTIENQAKILDTAA